LILGIRFLSVAPSSQHPQLTKLIKLSFLPHFTYSVLIFGSAFRAYLHFIFIISLVVCMSVQSVSVLSSVCVSGCLSLFDNWMSHLLPYQYSQPPAGLLAYRFSSPRFSIFLIAICHSQMRCILVITVLNLRHMDVVECF